MKTDLRLRYSSEGTLPMTALGDPTESLRHQFEVGWVVPLWTRFPTTKIARSTVTEHPPRRDQTENFSELFYARITSWQTKNPRVSGASSVTGAHVGLDGCEPNRSSF